jgi:hypothetical protein
MVGSDQVILFSLPVKKGQGKGMDGGMPGPEPQLDWCRDLFRLDYLTI